MILASLPSPPLDWRYFSIFGVVTVHVYALCILLGIIVATWWTGRRLTKRGGEKGVVLDFLLWVVPLGIIFARLYHVLTHWGDYFGAGKDPLSAFYIWEGGNAIFGALLGGALGVFIASRQTGIRFLSFADALIPGLLLAQATGRLGNYVNQELFGLPTDLPWGLVIDVPNPAIPDGLPPTTLYHPTFLYEILWNLAGIVLYMLIERGGLLRWGKGLGFYLIWYGIGRSWFESLRIDPSDTFLGIRTNIWASFAAILLGLVIVIVQSRRHPGLEESVYLPGRSARTPRVDSKAVKSSSPVGTVATETQDASKAQKVTNRKKPDA